MPSPDDPSGLDPTSGATAVDPRRNGHLARPNGPSADRSSGDRSSADPPSADRSSAPVGGEQAASVGHRSRPPGPSTRPALIVFGVTLALFILGAVAQVLTSGSAKPPPPHTSIPAARGAVLQALPARPLLQQIVTVGEPPGDLLNALVLPAGAAAVPGSATNRGVELYDRSLGFDVSASEQDVISFFRAELPVASWHMLSQGPAKGTPGYQILAQHPASDGLEWEVGVTVAPTTFGAPSATRGTTPFTVRLFAESDQA